ncbi:maleylacetoacetate isomerase [Aquitalea magnusonii]|uniref:Maleylacetoacetate isomerase n=1 Tax=Aquitalea magnusonii TaxID=332411 RepID=A0A3G9GLY6_9NEIS|nr:maleylacetoacetate isomerase [Aquitalea magnusonii]BBF86942.1 maleylacetoacetate isomerase [Aquitalea magnusonii]
MTERLLYGYYRSSAAYRVRIALNLKGLEYRQQAVNLLKGEQRDPAYLALNPQGLVPALLDGGQLLTQSLAICEYLDEAYPDTPALLPRDLHERARVRALALSICADIHPLHNARVLKYLEGELAQPEATRLQWIRHWIASGFAALEQQLAAKPQPFACGDAPGLLDACLVPQVFAARRFGLDLTPYPHIVRVDAALADLPAFVAAHPARQADAPPA